MSQVYKKDEQNVKLLATSAVRIVITSYTHIISSHKLSYTATIICYLVDQAHYKMLLARIVLTSYLTVQQSNVVKFILFCLW